jgi:hypothetical protein
MGLSTQNADRPFGQALCAAHHLFWTLSRLVPGHRADFQGAERGPSDWDFTLRI